MINLKQLLTKICESINTLKTWRTTAETSISNLYGNGYTGTVVSDSLSTTTSIHNDTWTEVLNVPLTPGIWFIIGRVTFAYNATGYRAMAITSRSASDGPATTNFVSVQDPITVDSGSTMLTNVCYANINANSTYRILVKHTRGSDLNISAAGLVAVRIADYQS